MADRRRVVQVLNKLFANAAGHAPESTPIRVAAAPEGARVVVSVSDEGRGVAPELLPYLFRKHAEGRAGATAGHGTAAASGPRAPARAAAPRSPSRFRRPGRPAPRRPAAPPARGILIENVAWAARRLPLFPIPAGPRYHIRPIHVDDYAAAVVDAVGATGTFVRDAIGPDRVEFGGLVESLVPLSAYFGGSGTPIPGCGTRISGCGTRISGEVERRFRSRERSSVA